MGRELAFRHVESGPLVRSSYHAKRQSIPRATSLHAAMTDVLRVDRACRSHAASVSGHPRPGRPHGPRSNDLRADLIWCPFAALVAGALLFIPTLIAPRRLTPVKARLRVRQGSDRGDRGPPRHKFSLIAIIF